MKRVLALVGLSVVLSVAMTLLVTTVVKVVPRLLDHEEEVEVAIEA
jgi:hypothetical protein